MERRSFLAASAAALLASRVPAQLPAAAPMADAPTFTTDDAPWQNAYDKALAVLNANVQIMPYVTAPVLIEGSQYQGIWQECGPLEALVWRKWRPDVARNSHSTFFELQRADGQLPANNKVVETGFGQIQMVVPIAATAWELARASGDSALLEAAYRACSAWDAWLMRYRNTRGTGLIEGFCTYDTGHDNSPRWAGMPNQCPNKDARRHHPIASLPRLCPDLSSTVFGGRRALAEMARALGRDAEADGWTERAETIRQLILKHLYVEEDAAFYDLDAQNAFVRVRGDILSRVVGEHVVDQRMFDDLWRRQLGKSAAFWAPYPLPSIALDDRAFVRPIPTNSWGGASQALTALRASRWMEHYGRAAEFSSMMEAWCRAIIADPTFRQQIDPLTGAFTREDKPGYSPSALVMLDYTWRLLGIVETMDELHWNVRPGHRAATRASFTMRTDEGRTTRLNYARGAATLTVGDRPIASWRRGTARLVTSKDGSPKALVGIDPTPQTVSLSISDRLRSVRVAANQRVSL